MTDLGPLFTDITISADEATAIVAALRDIAQVDGTHEDEIALIEAFSKELHEELGEAVDTPLEAMNPKLLGERIINEALRTVTIQTAIMLTMADGEISDSERTKVREYADALGYDAATYGALEDKMTSWIRSGDIEPVMGSIYS